MELRKQHVPIDGVGIQGHLSVQYNAPHDIADNMKRFDDLGLETAITEADVRVPMPSDSTKQEAQAEGYDVLLRGCLLTRHCTDFTVWGFTDKYSWVPGTFEGEGAANLFDENYAAKPAYKALTQDLLLAMRPGLTAHRKGIGMTNNLRITGVRIIPVAFRDPALLNAVGVHEPYALRAIVEVDTGEGLVGLGETYADEGHLRRLRAAADTLTGMDVYALGAMHSKVAEALAGDDGAAGSGLTGMITTSSAVDRVFSPFEVACLDLQGKAAGRPVSDLLGGAVRDSVPFSAYLFYKWGAHPGGEPDDWGAALDPDAVVAQARRMITEYGFTAVKLKGGVRPPEEEIEAVLALREALPGVPLRLDPNAAWSVPTSVAVAHAAGGCPRIPGGPDPRTRRRWRRWRGRPRYRSPPTCASSHSSTWRRPCGRAPYRWCSPTITTGAACTARNSSPASATPSAWGCPCTPTPTSASAWPL